MIESLQLARRKHGQTLVLTVIAVVLLVAIFLVLRFKAPARDLPIRVLTALDTSGTGKMVVVENLEDKELELHIDALDTRKEFTVPASGKANIGTEQGYFFTVGDAFLIGGDGFKTTHYKIQKTEEDSP